MLSKTEFEKIDNHTNKQRELFLDLICSWCKSKSNSCPSCDWRYTKLNNINKLLDGKENFSDFKDI